MEVDSQKVVRFVTLTAPKLPLYSIMDKNGSEIHVYDANLIRLLSEGLQVQYEIFTPPDGGFGTRQPDGNWSGMLGMVIRSEADLAMCAISITEERSEAMNFTYVYKQSRVTFMTDKPLPLSKNLAIFHPFSYEIWLILFILFATVALFFYVSMNKKKSMQSVVITVFGSIFEQSLNFNIKTTVFRILTFFWILGTMILTYSYKAVLLSFLSIPTLSGIKDIADLSKASTDNSFKCFTYNGGHLAGHFLKSTVDSWKPIGECLNRNNAQSGDALRAFDNADPKKAFVGSAYQMPPYANDYFISEDSFFITVGSIPFSRNFCCLDRLNVVIYRIVATGLLLKIRRENDFFSTLYRKSFASYVSDNTMKIYFDDISGAFYILMSGWFLSVIVFVVEISITKYFSKTD